MPTETSQLQSSIPVLASGDYARSKAFYVGQLGFVVVEEGGSPARFGIFEREDALIFVNSWNGAREPTPQCWSAYFHVSD